MDAFAFANHATASQFELLGDAARSHFDMVWVDLGAGPRIGRFVAGVWPSVNPRGGLLLLHSSLTNEVTRGWLEAMRRLSRRRMALADIAPSITGPNSGGSGSRVANIAESAGGEMQPDVETAEEAALGVPGLFVEVSFLEPHKLFQNSVTVFQRRDVGFAEPTFTTYG